MGIEQRALTQLSIPLNRMVQAQTRAKRSELAQRLVFTGRTHRVYRPEGKEEALCRHWCPISIK